MDSDDDVLSEVIVASTSHCAIYEPSNGNLLCSYKDCGTGRIKRNGMCMLSDDYFVGATEKTPTVQVWHTDGINNKHITTRFVVPSHISVVTSTRCGLYLAAASENKIYLWEVTTGQMLCILARHTQSIKCLRFNSDDSHLISGGDDACVHVWLFSEIVDESSANKNPRFSWSHHSAEITDIFAGSFGVYARIATCSSDMTCKIYELDTGLLLSTICTNQMLTSVCMDSLEYFAAIGTNKGHIYKVNLYDSLPNELHFLEDRKNSVVAHNGSILCMSISSETTNVLSAGDDHSIKLWDMNAMSCILTIKLEAPIGYAFFAPRPKSLYNFKHNEVITPSFCIRQFKKTTEDCLENKTEYEEHIPHSNQRGLEMTWVGSIKNPKYLDILYKIKRDEVSTPGPSKYEDMFQTVLNARTEDEMRLINSQLYSYALKRMMEKIEDSEMEH